jgi:hypothetical protein
MLFGPVAVPFLLARPPVLDGEGSTLLSVLAAGRNFLSEVPRRGDLKGAHGQARAPPR